MECRSRSSSRWDMSSVALAWNFWGSFRHSSGDPSLPPSPFPPPYLRITSDTWWQHEFLPNKQGLTGTRYPTRPDNFWQYPIHTRFIFRIIGYFGYRVFHLFWPNVPVTIQYCFNPHNICQVWTCHQSSLQRIQFLKSYNRDVGTVIYKIMPIIWHCAPFCTHYFFFPRNMLFSHKFMHFCHDFFVVEI